MNPVRWREVAVVGHRAGRGPATWGQRQAWRDLRRLSRATPAAYNNTLPVWVGAGVPLDTVVKLLAEVAGRHESLRTCFADHTGKLIQTVRDNGYLRVGVWTGAAAGAAELETVSRQLHATLADTVFDHATELPFRAVIVAPDHVPRLILICVSHLAADLLSTSLIANELTALLQASADGAPMPSPLPATEPLEIAAWERSAVGQRREAAALAQIRSELMAFPLANFRCAPSTPQQPRFWRGALESARLTVALDQVATRLRIGSSTVALAAVAALLGAVTGRSTVGMVLIAGNRAERSLRHTVAMLAQDAPAILDVAGPDFRCVAQAAWKASLRAYKHGRFNPDRAWEVVESVGRDRGAGPDLRCFFNDKRLRRPGTDLAEGLGQAEGPDQAGGTLPTRGEVEVFHWQERTVEDGVRFSVELDDLLTAPGATRLSLHADTAYLAPEAIEGFLCGAERLLTDLAAGDVNTRDWRTYL